MYGGSTGTASNWRVQIVAGHHTTGQGGLICLAGKVTAGLVESNCRLQLGLSLISPAWWLPRDWDQLRAQCS